MRVRVIGPGGQRALEGGDRLLGAARLPQDDSERIGRLRQLGPGIELERAAQRGLRAREIVLLLEGDAEVVERLRARRVAGGQPAIDLDRAREVALLQERAAQVVAGGGVSGLAGQHRLEGGHRRVAFALLHEREAERVPRFRGGGIQLHCLPQRGHRPVDVAPRAQGGAQMHVGGGQGRAQADDAAQMADGRGQVAHALEGQGQVVARLGVRGLEAHGFPQLGQRRRDVARPPERGPEMVAGVEQPRIERHCLAKAGEGVLRASLLAPHEPEAVVDLRA